MIKKILFFVIVFIVAILMLCVLGILFRWLIDFIKAGGYHV